MKKSLIAFALIVILFLLANWWAGRVISNNIKEELRELLVQNPEVNMSYQDINVTPLLSQFTLNQFQYQTADNIEFQSESIRFSITFMDFFRLLTNDPSNSFKKIMFLSIYLDNASLVDHNESSELTLDDGFFTLHGNLVEVLQSLMNNQTPDKPFTMEIDIYDLYNQSLRASKGFLPDFEQTDDFHFIQNAEGQLVFDPVLYQLNIRNAKMRAPTISIEWEGVGKYPKEESRFYPYLFNISYKLAAKPRKTQFSVSRMGHLSMNKVNIESTAYFDLQNPELSINNFFIEGLTSFAFEQVAFSPSENTIQEYGPILQAFGLDIHSLYLDSLNGQYLLENGQFNLQETELSTAFFSAILNIDLDINKHNLFESRVNKGNIRITDMTQQVRIFMDNVSVLFSSTYEKNEDTNEIIIMFQGPLQSPDINIKN
ncbi:MAG: hypothetical protein WD267_14135 [Balneolales bacterium]